MSENKMDEIDSELLQKLQEIGVVEAFVTVQGYLRRSSSGELVIDKCASDTEHLVAKEDERTGRRSCRHVLSDLVPKGSLGVHSDIVATVTHLPEGALQILVILAPVMPATL